MLLTCPTCRSGLEVPDGTTAMVRCPACKTVFSPEDSPAPEPDEEDEKPKAKTKTHKPARRQEDEDEDRPRKKGKRKDEEEDEKPKEENRDFDPLTEEEERKLKRKKRRSEADDNLSPEEKAARRAAFQRAAWGARLIWISLGLFQLSMVMILIFYFQYTFKIVSPACVVVAGFLGMFNWVLAAVGVGLCLSGPRSPGHWGYGIAAAAAVAIHGVLLLALVVQKKENFAIKDPDDPRGQSIVRWWNLATNLNSSMFYMTAVLYPDEQGIAKSPGPLPIVTGLFEMVRTMFIMMLLSCLARAALDDDLAHKCTRAAGIASGAPAVTALIILVVCSFLIETNAGVDLFTKILINTTISGVHAILMGIIFPSFMAAREVVDACDEPFQSLIPQL